jgi:hypothetical protein
VAGSLTGQKIFFWAVSLGEKEIQHMEETVGVTNSNFSIAKINF